MDNSNNISTAILEPTNFTASSSNYTTSFFDNLKNINMTTWLIIVLILAFLGFNIFAYLAKGTQDVTSVFSPIIQKIFGTTAAVSSQAIDVTAEGTKSVVSGTANTINTGLTDVQNVTPNHNIQDANTLNKALNSSQVQKQSSQDYETDNASSSIQSGGKQGWCYIGEDRGFRSCAYVGVNDDCMSGDIFPSKEICVNPSLRP
jgi:hypothetical protein